MFEKSLYNIIQILRAICGLLFCGLEVQIIFHLKFFLIITTKEYFAEISTNDHLISIN